MTRSLLVFSVLVISIFLNSSCKEKEEQKKQVIRPVRTITVDTTVGARTRSYSGVAHAKMESKLSFKVSGTVKKVFAKVGQTVKKGTVLSELDAKDYALQVEQSEASLEQAEAGRRSSIADFERARELFANKTISKQDYDRARASSESAKASVRAASKQVQLLRHQRNYTRLIAPSDGTISAVRVENSENIAQGQVIVVLTSGDEIEVKVAVPEVVISKIHKDDSATVKFTALSGREYKAKVEEVGISSIEARTTYPVNVRLIEKDKSIRAGMAAEVFFKFGQNTDKTRIVVPPSAVGEDLQGKFVFVVKNLSAEQGTVKRKMVKLGTLSSVGLEITDGLTDGEILVTAGIRFLEDGLKVRVPATSAKH